MEWNIQSRSHACQSCNKPFADKQAFHTILLDDKKFFQRLDVCEACWSGQHSQGANSRKGFISHWQSVFVVPPAAAPEAIQKDSAETLLRKLVERKDPQHAGACYILAVMLERKRILKVKAQHKQDGQRVFVYEHGKSGDLLVVPDPDLQFDQLEIVQKDIDHLLEHGLEDAPNGTPNTTQPQAPLEGQVQSAPVSPDASAEPASLGEAGIAAEPPLPVQQKPELAEGEANSVVVA